MSKPLDYQEPEKAPIWLKAMSIISVSGTLLNLFNIVCFGLNGKRFLLFSLGVGSSIFFLKELKKEIKQERNQKKTL